jgi:hypothetical protein
MSKEVEIEAEYIHETDLALLINDGDQEVWLPKSQIKYDYVQGSDSLLEIIVTMPEWLAIEKELI